MAQTNPGGLAGAAIGALAGYGVTTVLGKSGQTPIDSVAWGATAGCLAASMFGLLYDRSAVPEFRRSYKALTRHFTRGERGGPDYDPRERVAMFGIPVAFATFIIPILTGILWLVAWYSARQGAGWPVPARSFATFFAAGVAGVALTMIVGRATADHRLLEREIAFNTTPMVDSAQPAATSEVVAVPNAPPTDEELAHWRSRGRRDAVIVIVLAAALLAIHHFLALREGRYYPKIAYAGPMLAMVGFFGLFEPRIMTRHLPVGKHYPATILMWMLLALALGAAIGWQVDAWYHG